MGRNGQRPQFTAQIGPGLYSADHDRKGSGQRREPGRENICRRCVRPLEQPPAEFRVRLPASNIENVSPFLIRERVQILPLDIDLTAGLSCRSHFSMRSSAVAGVAHNTISVNSAASFDLSPGRSLSRGTAKVGVCGADPTNEFAPLAHLVGDVERSDRRRLNARAADVNRRTRQMVSNKLRPNGVKVTLKLFVAEPRRRTAARRPCPSRSASRGQDRP